MPRLTPLSHREMVRKLQILGFVGPRFGGRYAHMIRDDLVIPIPIHGGKDIGVGLISTIIKQIGITREQWIQL